jgi:aminopeptidase YwaD
MVMETMPLRILLAAIAAALIVSGCSLPGQAPGATPAATVQPAPTLASQPVQPSPAPASPTAQPATNAPATPAAVQGALPEPTSTPVPSPTRVVAPPTPTSVPVAPSTPTMAPTPALAPTATPSPVPAAFSGQRAWEDVRHLAVEIGSRPSDTEEQREAARYIRDQFIAMGYGAELEPYTFAQFREKVAQLVVEQPQQVAVEARAVVYSGSGSVQEQLAFVGLGRPSDFPAAGLQGRIALIERGQITFEDKVANAIAQGASAVVVYNNQPGSFPATLLTPATVPAVAISQVDGQRLRDLLRQGPVTARVSVEAGTVPVEGNNVVAPHRVSTDRRTVVIGAHYDSVDAGPGANDNASGVATMLEIARVARDRSYPFDLVFVAFGDEEIGLIGSNRHVQKLSDAQRQQIVAMINLDMVGVGERIQFGGTDWLAGLAEESARRAGYAGSQINLPSGMSSDHASFMAAGIPSVFF